MENLDVEVHEENSRGRHRLGRIPFSHRDTMRLRSDLTDLIMGTSITVGTAKDNAEVINRLESMEFKWYLGFGEDAGKEIILDRKSSP